MRKNKIIYPLFCLFLIGGCLNKRDDKKNPVNNEAGASTINHLSIRDSLLNVYKNEKYFNFKRNIKNGVYDLVIETNYKNDTLFDDIPLEFASPVIISQKLFIKKNDTIVRDIYLPFEKINKQNRHRENIEIAEISIWLIYSVKGINETILFGICGTNLCLVGDCKEFSALFSENGDLLTQCYYVGNNKLKGSCIEQDILGKYGITDSILRSAQNKGVLVDIWR